jgi:hypothetical protein
MAIQAVMQAAGVVGNTIGAIGNLAGAVAQKKEAKKQLEIGNKLAAQQRLDFQQTYGDLDRLLQGQATYKGDVSEFKRAESEAQRQQIMAQNVPASDQLYREQARRTSGNTFARGTKGARSGTDLMSLAGMVGDQEDQQMQRINIDTANRGMDMQQRANQNMISTIASTAAATARERGLEFDSILSKSNAGISLAREKGLGGMEQEWNLTQQNMAQRGALANSKAAVMSGIGGIFKAMGGGVAQMNMQNQQMELLRGMKDRPSGKFVAPEPVSGTAFYKPNFNAANGYDLRNLAGNSMPIGFNPDNTLKYR